MTDEKKIKIVRIPTDVDVAPSFVEITQDLDAMQAEVEGVIQTVQFECGDFEFEMVLNEEGKLRDMQYNILGTLLTRSVLFDGDYIVGPVFLVGPVDEHGYFTSVSEEAYAVIASKWALLGADDDD